MTGDAGFGMVELLVALAICALLVWVPVASSP